MCVTFCSLNSSIGNCGNNTLNHEPCTGYNDKTNILNKLWTLKLKPPTNTDAIQFIEQLKNIHYNKQCQLKHNNIIDNIRKDLLSLSFPVSNNLNFFASESYIILEPLKQPPSYLMAFKWLETRCSKYKYKKNSSLCNKRKGIMTPESISKSILLKKINHSTPNSSQSRFHNSTPYTPRNRENKCFKSRRKLSTLFLDSLNVRKFTPVCLMYNIILYFRLIQVMIQEVNFSIHLELSTVQTAIF